MSDSRCQTPLGHPQHSPTPKLRKHLDRGSRKIRREPEHLLQADIPWTWQRLYRELTTIWLPSQDLQRPHQTWYGWNLHLILRTMSLNSTLSALHISLKLGWGGIRATDVSVCKRGSGLSASWNLADVYVLQVRASTAAFVLRASAFCPGFSALPLLFLPLLCCHHLLTSSEKFSFANSRLFSPSRVFSRYTYIQWMWNYFFSSFLFFPNGVSFCSWGWPSLSHVPHSLSPSSGFPGVCQHAGLRAAFENKLSKH